VQVLSNKKLKFAGMEPGIVLFTVIQSFIILMSWSRLHVSNTALAYNQLFLHLEQSGLGIKLFSSHYSDRTTTAVNFLCLHSINI